MLDYGYQNNNLIILEESLTAISTIATIIEEKFGQFYS